MPSSPIPTSKCGDADGEDSLPSYKVTLGRVLRGILPFGKPHMFRQATERDDPATVTRVNERKVG